MIRITGYCLVVVLFVCLESALPASRSRSNLDMRVVADKPTVFISFVRIGPRKPLEEWESDQGIWLRVHNNTKWSLIFNAAGVPDSSYGDAVLFYRIERTDGEQGRLPIGYQRHVSSVIQLASGQSLLFSLPREHLAKGLAIQVAYNYEWELTKDRAFIRQGEPRHLVLFDSSQIPPTD